MRCTFTDDENKNIVLVVMYRINDNVPSMTGERGIVIDYLSSEASLEIEKLTQYLNDLSKENYVELIADKRVKLTTNGKEYLDKNSTFTLKQTSSQILHKTFEIYLREDYNDTIQFNSFLVGCCLGMANINKVNSAVKELIDIGYLKKLVMTRDFISYYITNEGINFIESDNSEEEKIMISPVIINNRDGNVAINSTNVKQNINNNDLTGYFQILEKLITENMGSNQKPDALFTLEIIQELSKVDPPKKPLIQKLLDNLDKIPVLFEIVEKIREYFQ
jgi:hypothetical protein